MDTRRYRKFPVQNGALMRINDLYGIQNVNGGVNNDSSLVDDAYFSENKKTAAPSFSLKGAVGFFNSQETKNVSGRTAGYTRTGALGNVNGFEGLGKKMLEEADLGHDNNKELVKNLTGDDYEFLNDEGMSIEKFSKERLEKAIERIKENREIRDIRLEEGAQKREEIRESFERMAINVSLNTGSEKQIAKMLYEADIPVTEENIEAVKQAADKAVESVKLSDSSKSYLIKNELDPTIGNIYKASHSGEMRMLKLEDSAWEKLKGKAYEIISETKESAEAITVSGKTIENPLQKLSPAENLNNARWLIEHDIPLTKENLTYKAELDILAGGELEGEEEVFGAAIEAIREGLPAENGLLIEKNAKIFDIDVKEFSEVAEASKNISNEAIKLVYASKTEAEDISLKELTLAEKEIEADKGNGAISANVSGSLTIKEVRTRIQLEELRVNLNVEAARGLMAKGINIISDGLMRVTEGIRELEREYFRDLYGEIAADNGKAGAVDGISDEKLELALKTEESLRNIADSPLELYKVTFSSRHSITIAELSDKGVEIRETTEVSAEAVIKISPASMRNALAGYEGSATEVRRDLGDSIKKAFSGSVDSLLSQNGLEITEANRRAVRILGYNSMEITAESINEIKFYDTKVTGLVEKMTPPVVMSMIRDGINPLDVSIDELDAKLNEFLKEQGSSSEQKYGEFLVRMEESRSITENERNAYVGVYRLLYNISKNDGAALGAALNSGKELSLRNLMTEVRSERTDIDFKVDDDTEQKTSYYSNSVTGQIDDAFAYQRGLLDRALNVSSPEAWSGALSGRDLGNVSLEELTEKLEAVDSTDPGAVRKAETIVRTMTTDSAVSNLLKGFGIRDSFENRRAANDVLTGTPLEDSAVAVSSDELKDALISGSKTDELLGIKTRMANVLTGQAFKTAITAQAAAELNSRVERIEMLQKLAGKGHYRFEVTDENDPAQVNLTLIRNSGNSGTVSIQISKEAYELQADMSMVITDAKYGGPSAGVNLHVNRKKESTRAAVDNMTDPEIIGSLSESLAAQGITAENITTASGGRPEESYYSYLAGLKGQEETDGIPYADELYKAAGAILAVLI